MSQTIPKKAVSEEKPFYKSKKWWMAIIGCVTTVVGSYVKLPTEVILSTAGLILGYIFTQGSVDVKKAANGK